MRRFRFKLQPVLDQRGRVERDRQLAVAEVEREKNRLENQIRRCQQMMDDEKRTLRDTLGEGGGGVDLQSVKLQASATLGHHLDAHRAVLELAGVYTKLEQARKELVQASAEKKAVELLKDRALQAYKDEIKATEAKELDELAVMRHTRTQGSIL